MPFIVQSRIGTQETFEELAGKHHARAYKTALAIVRSHHDAQDVVQTAFLRAYAHRYRFRGDASFATWLTAIVRHQAIDHRRAAHRQRHVVASLGDPSVLARAASRAQSPEDALLDNERQRHLSECIDALPVPFREALQLANQGDYSYADIGAKMRTPIGTVKSRVSTARRIVRRLMLQRCQQRCGKDACSASLSMRSPVTQNPKFGDESAT